MKNQIIIPSMGESLIEAVVGQVLKPSGSFVKVDEEILELETDKVNQVLYAPSSGEIHLSVQAGDKVQIGQVIGFVETAYLGIQASSRHQLESHEIPKKPTEAPLQLPEYAQNASSSIRFSKSDFIDEIQRGVLANPSALVYPKISHIDRSHQPSNELPNERRVPMSRMRQVIAKRLVEAQHSSAMLTTFNEVDMSHVMQMRSEYKEAFEKKYAVKLGLMSFFVKACTVALEAVPEINASIDETDIVYRNTVDIGIAVSTERGLIVPILRNCQHLTFAEIEQGIVDYAKKAKEGKLTLDALQGGGFTITNGGVYGSLLSTPILNPPQSGILGMHKIEKRPVVIEDVIVIRPMMYVALSYDHRIVDGMGAVSFLVKVKEVLEDPERLLLKV